MLDHNDLKGAEEEEDIYQISPEEWAKIKESSRIAGEYNTYFKVVH